MIGFLDGVYKGLFDDFVEVECSGIGFQVYATNSVLCNLPCEGENLKIYIYMNVKDDGITLFGFVNREEKRLFLKLITVSGVGAKTAIQVLSSLKFIDIVSSIAAEDATLIMSVKGIGKKTAERIVLELKDKLNPLDYIADGYKPSEVVSDNIALVDAVVVLTSLGIRQADAMTSARRVASVNDTAENIVAKVLKEMGE